MMNNPFASILAGRKLSADESTELAAQVAQLARSGLPLDAGLRAFSEELPNGRLASVLRKMADRLASGQPIEAVFDAQRGIPAHLRGLIVAGVRTGRLGEVLEEYVALRQEHREIRRRMWLGIAYPLCLLLLLCAVFFLLRFVVLEPFVKIFDEFGLRLPKMTILMIFLFRNGVWLVLLAVFFLLAIPAIVWLEPGLRGVSSLMQRIPVIGPLLRWSGLAQFSYMMQLLLENQVPLPDALRLTAGSLPSADLGAACRKVATDVEGGRGFCESLATRRQFPARLIPLVDWGQRTPALPESFRAAAEMFGQLFRARATMTSTILVPLFYFLVVAFIGLVLLVLFLPMIDLVSNLSGAGAVTVLR